MDLKEEAILAEKIHTHWYYVSKGRAMLEFLRGVRVDEVLDVGAGSGVFSRQLLDNGVAEAAVCVDPNYLQERTEVQNGKAMKFVRVMGKSTQKLILMMDVLEHVPDDVAFIRAYTDGMPLDGKVFVTVPAFQFVWSGHDVFLGHYRRYTITTMENAIRKAGLHPIKSRYFFGSLFPVVAAIRLVKNTLVEKDALEAKSELKDYPKWLNAALTYTHSVERRILFPFNRILGLSVFCLCEKRRGEAQC